jgi:hypothetical protein
VLINDVIYVASGRRQVLLVVALWFETRFIHADAVGVFGVPAVRHVVHVSGLWLLLLLLLLAIWREFTGAGQLPVTEPEVSSKTLFGHSETGGNIVTIVVCPSDQPHTDTGNKGNEKIKRSHYRPGQALGVSGV